MADTDSDGAITEAEMVADFSRVFRGLDLNGDGILSAAEIDAYEMGIPEMRGPGSGAGGAPGSGGPGGGPAGGPRGGPGGGGPGGLGGNRPLLGGPPVSRDIPIGQQPTGGGVIHAPRPDGVAAYGFMNDPEPVLSADTDMSHTVTAAEFEARARRLFRSLDMNADGRLLRAELPENQSGR
jgi:hypothetical protein